MSDLGMRNVNNTWALLEHALRNDTPTPTMRDLWVERFETHAVPANFDGNGERYWVPVETAADLVMDAEG